MAVVIGISALSWVTVVNVTSLAKTVVVRGSVEVGRIISVVTGKTVQKSRSVIHTKIAVSNGTTVNLVASAFISTESISLGTFSTNLNGSEVSFTIELLLEGAKVAIGNWAGVGHTGTFSVIKGQTSKTGITDENISIGFRAESTAKNSQ